MERKQIFRDNNEREDFLARYMALQNVFGNITADNITVFNHKEAEIQLF